MQKNTTTTEYKKALRQRIIDAAMQCFMQKGIKAVRMDDIANELSISKRTLYEIFQNKEDLLFEGVKNATEQQRQSMLVYSQQHNDVMQIILHFYVLKIRELDTVNPLFFTEINKYDKVRNYLQERHEEQRKNTNKFFMRGVEEGYFLPQLNYDIVTRLGDASMEYVMSTKMYKEYSLQELFKNFVSVLLRGYCTEKGQRLLEKSL